MISLKHRIARTRITLNLLQNMYLYKVVNDLFSREILKHVIATIV